jgi:hypothetical protein
MLFADILSGSASYGFSDVTMLPQRFPPPGVSLDPSLDPNPSLGFPPKRSTRSVFSCVFLSGPAIRNLPKSEACLLESETRPIF